MVPLAFGCHIVLVLFPFGGPSRWALSIFEDAWPPDSKFTVEVMGGIRAQGGRDEHHLRNIAPVVDLHRPDVFFARERADLLYVSSTWKLLVQALYVVRSGQT